MLREERFKFSNNISFQNRSLIDIIVNKCVSGHLLNNQFQFTVDGSPNNCTYVKPIKDPIEGVTRWT